MSNIIAVQRGIDYIARVTAVGGTDKFLMVQVEIPELLAGADPDLLPWATYLLPVGFRLNEGDFTPVQIEDWVWVDFPFMSHGEVDTRRPRIKGAMHAAPDEIPLVPHDVFGGDEKLEHKRTDLQPKPAAKEPNQARVITIGGLTVEMERDGAYRVTNRGTGTAFEITEEGQVVNHSEKEQFMSSVEKTLIESAKEVEVHGTKIDLGKEGLEPMVLGDMLAAFFEMFKTIFENHKHIGNLGAPTSPMVASDGPVDFAAVLLGGNVYSIKNRTQ